jgi:putative transposase
MNNRIQEGFAYYLTLTVVDWVDVFTRPCYKHIITESLQYCQKNKGLEIMAWVLMSNHLHMIAQAKEGYILSDILRDFKKYTSKKITEAIQNEPESRREWLLDRFEFTGRNNHKIKYYKFWQDGNEAKEIHTTQFLEQKMEYIHQNPVRAEIVQEAHEYLYSSAVDYADGKGLV